MRVHENKLHCGSPTAHRSVQIVAVEFRCEGLDAEASEQSMIGSSAGRPEHRAEAARVPIAHDDAIAEDDIDVVMRFFGRRIGEHAEASRHPQVDEKGIRAKAEKQVLAAPIHAVDAAADEPARQIARNRPAQSMVVDPHRGHFLPFHVRSDAAPRRFYLRKLGHGAVFAAVQRIVASATIP